MLTDAAIVAHISQLPHSRANFKQLVRELGLRWQPQRLGSCAHASHGARRPDRIEKRQYVVTARTREFAVGRLNLHRDGYGFLISERPIPGVSGDIFISPKPPKRPCTATA